MKVLGSGRWIALGLTVLILSCGPGGGEDFRDLELRGQALSVAAVTGCSLAAVRGLDEQLIAETNCLVPGSLVDFTDLDVGVGGSSTWPMLQQPAKDGLAAAIASRQLTLNVNTAYRTIAQQYLLYNWGQQGECGIGLAAVPGHSNHQSGLALDVSDYDGWKPYLEANGWRWFGANDAVHFDYVTGGEDIRGTSVIAFQRLWNRNNPDDEIAEDGVYGAQTEARLEASPADGFPVGASCSTEPPVDVVVRLSDALTGVDGQDFELVEGGLSAGVFDVLEGQRFTWTVVLHNDGDRATDPVLIGADLVGEGLEITGYAIDTDYPALDAATWVTSDAGDLGSNPAPSAIASGAVIDLNPLGPGESKRVVFEVRALHYGGGLHQRLRAWVKHVGGFYGEQDGWDDPAELNLAGETLRRELEVDVWAGDQWEFEGDDPDDLEGWTPCSDTGTGVWVELGSLWLDSATDNPCVEAPGWTSMVATEREGVEITVQHDAEGPGEVWVLWSSPGQGFDAEHREIVSLPPGAQDPVTVVVPFETTVRVTGLRLMVTANSGSYGFDAIRSAAASDAPPSPDSDLDAGLDLDDLGNAALDAGLSDGGAMGDAPPNISGDAGCACMVRAHPGSVPSALWVVLLMAAALLRSFRRWVGGGPTIFRSRS